MNTVVVPAATSRSAENSSSSANTSRLAVGSSSSSTAGLRASTRAAASLCHCPVESETRPKRRPRRVSSRPSDALALALRVGCSIFAEEDVLDEAGLVDESDDEEPEEVVEKFREFIDSVNPDDFAS